MRRYLVLLTVLILGIVILYKVKTNDKKQTNNTEENFTQCEKYLEKINRINQTLEWKLLKCGLWQNNKDDIGFQTQRVICSDGLILVVDYITKFGFNEYPPLKEVVDTMTFKALGNSYYKDKNYIYHHYSMSDGGSFYIFDKADYQTFQILDGCYAKDKNHIFDYRGTVIENVDYETFTTRKGVSGCVAKDKNGYVSFGERIDENNIHDDGLKEEIEKLKDF